MKFKKYTGSFILMLTALIVNVRNASFAAVGVEEMPESMKEIR